MARYTFECDKHGDFEVEQPMAETTLTHLCPKPRCKRVAKKVIGAAFVFPYGGRKSFHDGPARDGRTGREMVSDWVADWDASGTKYEPIGSRWV